MPDPLKIAMKTVMSLHIPVYRASKGRLMGTRLGWPVALLTVKGRKTGKLRTTPLIYLEENGKYVVVGSAAGLATEPAWFRNLRAAGTAVLQVRDREIEASVAIADQEERDRLWKILVAKGSFFADYQAKTDRLIPIALLTPLATR